MHNPPPIETLNHVAIEVNNLEAAEAFYGLVIGLRALKTPPAAADKGIRWFALPEGRMLHLVHAPETKPSRFAHFAMTVPDVAQWRDYLRRHNVEELPATVAVYGAVDRLYVKDPSGNTLEFVKWAANPE
jgi:catechol 2,3-dioxygenase-like lactoylglutathione lyase family enzyme